MTRDSYALDMYARWGHRNFVHTCSRCGDTLEYLVASVSDVNAWYSKHVTKGKSHE